MNTFGGIEYQNLAPKPALAPSGAAAKPKSGGQFGGVPIDVPKGKAQDETEKGGVAGYINEMGDTYTGTVAGSWQKLKDDFITSLGPTASPEALKKFNDSPLWDKAKTEFDGFVAAGMLAPDAFFAIISPFVTAPLKAVAAKPIAKGIAAFRDNVMPIPEGAPVPDTSWSGFGKTKPYHKSSQDELENTVMEAAGMVMPAFKGRGGIPGAIGASKQVKTVPRSTFSHILQRPLTSAEDFSKRYLARKLQKEGITAEQAKEQLKKPGSALVDLGETHMAEAGEQAVLAGEGRRLGSNLFNTRLEGRSDRGVASANSLVNDKNMFEHIDQADEARRVNAKPLYEQAFEGGSHAPLKGQFQAEVGEAATAVDKAREAVAEVDARLAGPATLKGTFEADFSQAGKAVNAARQAVQDADTRITMVESKHRGVGDNVYGNAARNAELKAAEKAKADAQAQLDQAEINQEGALGRLRKAQEHEEGARTKAKADADAKLKEAEAAHQDAQDRLKVAEEHEATGKPGGIWSPALKRLLTHRIFQPGLETGYQLIKDEAFRDNVPFNPHEWGIEIVDGKPVPAKVPNLRVMDMAKRGIDENFRRKYTNDLGEFRPDKEGQVHMAIRDQFVDELDRLTDPTGAGGANSPYRAARAAWEGPSEIIDAVHDGLKFANEDVKHEQIAKKIAKMKPHEKEGYQIGAARWIADKIAKGPSQALSMAKRIMTDGPLRVKLHNIFGDEHFKVLTDMAQNEIAWARRHSEVGGGSQSARRLEGSKQFQDFSEELANEVFKGNISPKGLANWGVRRWAEHMYRGMSQERRDAVAKLLFSTDEADKMRAIDLIYEEGNVTVPGFGKRKAIPGAAAADIAHQPKQQQQQDQPQQ